MSKQEYVELEINNFEIEFDCPDHEKETLEKKLNLISLGNGKDLCIIACNDDYKECKPAKLKVREHENIDRDYCSNGGIEIEVSSPNISILANNCTGAYHVPEKNFMQLHYGDRELVVRIIYDKTRENG